MKQHSINKNVEKKIACYFFIQTLEFYWQNISFNLTIYLKYNLT